MGGEAGAGHDVVALLGEAGDGEVALDAAAAVEHLGIDDPARRLCHVVRAKPAERPLGVAADDEEFGEGGLIEEGDRLARGAVLATDRLEPVLPAEAVDVLRRLAGSREPVRPLPAELRAEAGAGLLETRIEGRDAERPAARIFLVRPGHGVMLAVGLARAREHPALVAVEGAEAADVDGPEVHGRLAADDPFGERAAGAAA